MVFFVVFLAGTIFFFVGPETIFGNDCTSGSKTTLVNELYDTSNEAYDKFCRECACKITNGSYLYKNLTDIGGYNITDGGSAKFGDCSANKVNITSSNTNIEILAALENLLQCGGWCPLDKEVKNQLGFYTYRFRNIDDCNTKGIFLIMKNVWILLKIVMINLKNSWQDQAGLWDSDVWSLCLFVSWTLWQCAVSASTQVRSKRDRTSIRAWSRSTDLWMIMHKFRSLCFHIYISLPI